MTHSQSCTYPDAITMVRVIQNYDWQAWFMCRPPSARGHHSSTRTHRLERMGVKGDASKLYWAYKKTYVHFSDGRLDHNDSKPAQDREIWRPGWLKWWYKKKVEVEFRNKKKRKEKRWKKCPVSSVDLLFHKKKNAYSVPEGKATRLWNHPKDYLSSG